MSTVVCELYFSKSGCGHAPAEEGMTLSRAPPLSRHGGKRVGHPETQKLSHPPSRCRRQRALLLAGTMIFRVATNAGPVMLILCGNTEMDRQLLCRVLFDTNSKLVNIHARGRNPDVEEFTCRLLFQREKPLLICLRGSEDCFPVRATNFNCNAARRQICSLNLNLARKRTANGYFLLHDERCRVPGSR